MACAKNRHGHVRFFFDDEKCGVLCEFRRMRTLAIIATLFFLSPTAHADDADSLDLMRALVAEVGRDGSTAECVAVLHVFRERGRRVGKSDAQVARAYSVALNGRSTNHARAARMRSLAVDDVPRHIRRVVTAWMSGRRIASPCPGARHFAHPSLRTPLERVACTAETRNAFYR